MSSTSTMTTFGAPSTGGTGRMGRAVVSTSRGRRVRSGTATGRDSSSGRVFSRDTVSVRTGERNRPSTSVAPEQQFRLDEAREQFTHPRGRHGWAAGHHLDAQTICQRGEADGHLGGVHATKGALLVTSSDGSLYCFTPSCVVQVMNRSQFGSQGTLGPELQPYRPLTPDLLGVGNLIVDQAKDSLDCVVLASQLVPLAFESSLRGEAHGRLQD